MVASKATWGICKYRIDELESGRANLVFLNVPFCHCSEEGECKGGSWKRSIIWVQSRTGAGSRDIPPRTSDRLVWGTEMAGTGDPSIQEQSGTWKALG